MESCPFEVVENILEYLPVPDLKNFSMVSHRFKATIENSPKLLRKCKLVIRNVSETGEVLDTKSMLESRRRFSNIKIESRRQRNFYGDLKIIRNNQGIVRNLELQGCEYLYDGYSSIVRTVASSIRELKFIDCDFARNRLLAQGTIYKMKKQLREIPKKNFEHLRKLEFHNTSFKMGQIFKNETIMELIVSLDERSYLSKDFRHGKTSVDVLTLLIKFPHLKKFSFKLNERPNLSEDLDYVNIFERMPGKNYQLPELEHLELDNILDPSAELTKSFITSFSTSLTSLVLGNCLILSSTFVEILESLQLLEKIHISKMFGELEDTSFVHHNLKEMKVILVTPDVHPEDCISLLTFIDKTLPKLNVLKSNVPAQIFSQNGTSKFDFVHIDLEGESSITRATRNSVAIFLYLNREDPSPLRRRLLGNPDPYRDDIFDFL